MRLYLSENKQSKVYYVGTFIILALLSAFVYYPSLFYGFLFDDYPNIVNRATIRHDTLSSLFFSHSRWIVFWLNALYYKAVEFHPFYYRLGNLIIHLTNGFLLFVLFSFILSRFKRSDFISANAHLLSFLTAGIFLLHPVQTQTVCYVIQGQLEGCALLSMLLIILCYTLYSFSTSPQVRIATASLVLLFGALSVGTKEIAIVTPLLVLLIDWFFIAQGDSSSLKRRLGVLALLAVIIVACFCYVLKPDFFFKLLSLQITPTNNAGNTLTAQVEELITPLHFFISQFKVILHYLLIFVWPFELSVDYAWKLSDSFWSSDSFFPFVILICIASFILKKWQKDALSMLTFTGLWFCITILPRASFIPSSELLADYKTYQASVALSFLFALVLAKGIRAFFGWYATQPISSPQWHPALLGSLGIVLASQGLLARQRTRVWSSKKSFWHDALKHEPEKARPYNNYAFALMEEKRYTEALPYLEKALALDPYYADAWNNLAIAEGNLGNSDKAIEDLQRALSINPSHAESYNNLAATFIIKKDYATAEKLLKKALSVKKQYGTALFQLGKIAFLQDKIEEAYTYFKQACTNSDRTTADAYACWGMTSMMLHYYDDALTAYTTATRLKPEDDELTMHLAYAHLYTKQHHQAEKLFKQLINQHPHDTNPLLGLADVFIATQRYALALDIYQKLESHTQHEPLILLRLAGCHYKLGNIATMRLYLHRLLLANPPLKLKATIEELLEASERGDYTATVWQWFH